MTDQPSSQPDEPARGRHRSRPPGPHPDDRGCGGGPRGRGRCVTWLVRSQRVRHDRHRVAERCRDRDDGSAGLDSGLDRGPDSRLDSRECRRCRLSAVRRIAGRRRGTGHRPTLAQVVEQQGLTRRRLPDPVEPVDPAQVAVSGSVDAAVWIPDSSIWLQRAAAAGLSVASPAPSIASSPVVFALSGQARNAGVRRCTAGRRGHPGDPEDRNADPGGAPRSRAIRDRGRPPCWPRGPRSPARTDARAALTWALRSSPADLPTASGELLGRLAADPSTAVPVSEQALVAYDRGSRRQPRARRLPGAGGFALDYPVVADRQDPAVADGRAGPVRRAADRRGRRGAAGRRVPRSGRRRGRR